MNGVTDNDFIVPGAGFMNEGGHHGQAGEEGEMGRSCGSESFLPQEGRKDACVTRVLVTEKANEVSFLESAQHIPHPCFIFHLLPRHGAVFTEETIEVFILLLHGHGKEGIAIEGKGRSFHFPVAAVGSSQDAAFPLFLQGIQFFFSPDGDIVPDIVFMEKSGKASSSGEACCKYYKSPGLAHH